MMNISAIKSMKLHMLIINETFLGWSDIKYITGDIKLCIPWGKTTSILQLNAYNRFGMCHVYLGTERMMIRMEGISFLLLLFLNFVGNRNLFQSSLRLC